MERIRGHDRTAGLCLLSAQPIRRRRRLLLRRQRMGEAARRAVLSDRSGSRGPRNGEADLRPRRLRLGQRSKTRLAGRNLLDPGLVEHRSEHRVEHASGGARGAAVPDHRNHELPRLGVGMYHWTNHNLRRPDRLYSDHLDRAGTIEPAVWSYNQGVPIDVNVSALPGNARSEIPGGGPAHRLFRRGLLRHQRGNLNPAGLLQLDLFQEPNAARIDHRWLDLSPGDAVLRRQRLGCEPGCRDRAVPLRRRSHPGHRPVRDCADLRRSGMGPTAAAFTALSTVTVREALEIRATEKKS